MIMYSTDKAMGHACELVVCDLRADDQLRSNTAVWTQEISSSKITSAVWGPLDEVIITGHENGDLCQWEMESQEMVRKVSEHTKQINDIQLSKDMNMLITASKDTTAKLFDTYSLDVKKTYKTERPVNSAAISPIKPHVILGGGQEAMDVTTTNTRVGKFDARLYHLVFEEEFARIKGHFGPINSISFHPDGTGYSSGGEDGYTRVHQLDAQYFEFDFEF